MMGFCVKYTPNAKVCDYNVTSALTQMLANSSRISNLTIISIWFVAWRCLCIRVQLTHFRRLKQYRDRLEYRIA